MTDKEAVEVAQTIKRYFDPKALPEFHEALDRLIANTERKLYGGDIFPKSVLDS